MGGKHRQERGLKEKCIHKLRYYSLLSQLASLLVIIVGSISVILFILPTLVGVELESVNAYQGRVIWLIFGLVFISIGIFFNLVAFRWPRVLLGILRSQPSSPMRFQLKIKEGKDSSQYYAYLTESSSARDASTWCIGLWAVSQEIEGWLDRVCSAKVYRDPKTGNPAVIELEDMYLWAMRGDVKRI